MTIKSYYDDTPDLLKKRYYFLYDLDGNDTKELLLGQAWGEDIYLYAVYAIKNGIAVRQEEYWYDPQRGNPPLLYKNGIIRVEADGDTMLQYYRFEDGELKFQIMLIDDYSPVFDSGNYKRVDEKGGFSKIITKAEFDRLQKEFEGDGQVIELDWKPLAEYGR